MSSELTQRESGSAAHVLRHIESALNGEIGSLPRAFDRLELEYAPRLHGERRPVRDGVSIEFSFHLCPTQRDHRASVELQRWSADRELQAGSVRFIAEDSLD